MRLIFVRSKCDFYLLFHSQYVREVTYNPNPSTMFGPSNRNIRLSLCNETSFHSAEGIFLEVVQKVLKAFRKFSKRSGVTLFKLA